MNIEIKLFNTGFMEVVYMTNKMRQIHNIYC
jgi:hypothetical protein